MDTKGPRDDNQVFDLGERRRTTGKNGSRSLGDDRLPNDGELANVIPLSSKLKKGSFLADLHESAPEVFPEPEASGTAEVGETLPERSADRTFMLAMRQLVKPMADYGRFERGSDYFRDGRVELLGIDIRSIRFAVKGTQNDPFRVVVRIPPLNPENYRRALQNVPKVAGKLTPKPSNFSQLFAADREQLQVDCDCPDRKVFCKHVIASLLFFADSMQTDPTTLLAPWGIRGGSIPRWTRTKFLSPDEQQELDWEDETVAEPMENEVLSLEDPGEVTIPVFFNTNNDGVLPPLPSLPQPMPLNPFDYDDLVDAGLDRADIEQRKDAFIKILQKIEISQIKVNTTYQQIRYFYDLLMGRDPSDYMRTIR